METQIILIIILSFSLNRGKKMNMETQILLILILFFIEQGGENEHGNPNPIKIMLFFIEQGVGNGAGHPNPINNNIFLLNRAEEMEMETQNILLIFFIEQG